MIISKKSKKDMHIRELNKRFNRRLDLNITKFLAKESSIAMAKNIDNLYEVIANEKESQLCLTNPS